MAVKLEKENGLNVPSAVIDGKRSKEAIFVVLGVKDILGDSMLKNKTTLLLMFFVLFLVVAVPVVSAAWYDYINPINYFKGNELVKSPKWIEVYSDNPDFYSVISDPTKQDSDIYLCSKTAIKKSDLKDLDFATSFKAEAKELKSKEKLKAIEYEGKYCYYYKPQKEEKFLKFDKHSTHLVYSNETIELYDNFNNYLGEVSLVTEGLVYLNDKPHKNLGLGNNQLLHQFHGDITLLTNLKAINMNDLVEANKNLHIKKARFEIVQEPIYQITDNCSYENTDLPNCEVVIEGYYNKTVTIWEELNGSETIEVFGIFGDVRKGDYYDVTFDYGGVSVIDYWATISGDLLTDLLAYYPTNETSGTTMIDYTNTQNSTISGSVSLGFDGFDNDIYNFSGGTTTFTGISSTTKSYTFSFLADHSGDSDHQIIDMETVRLVLSLKRNSAGIDNKIGFYDGGWENFGVTANVSQLNHYVFVFNGTKAKLYINGTKQTTEPTWTPLNIGGTAKFGSDISDGNTYKGRAGDLIIWERALSEDEINEIYADDKDTPTLNISIDKTSPQTYGETINVSCTTDSNSTLTGYINDSAITLNTNILLSAGYYEIKCNTTENDYWASKENETTFTINKATPTGTITGTSPIGFGTAANVEGTESNTGDGDVTYNLYRNGTLVDNPDLNSSLPIGVYGYVYNTTGGANYSANSSIDTFTLEVIDAPAISVVLLSPANNFNTTSKNINFSSNVTAVGGARIMNVSLYFWDSDNVQYGPLFTEDDTSLYNYVYEVEITDIDEGTWRWNTLACSNDSTAGCSFATTNRTFTIDSSAPTITIQSGEGLAEEYIFFTDDNITWDEGNQSHTINFTATDDNLDSCWIIYYDEISSSEETIDVSCTSGVEVSQLIESFEWNVGSTGYNATVYANDTFGNEVSYDVYWYYRIQEIQRTFESPVVYTSSDVMDVWFYNNETISKVELIYKGVAYEMDFVQSYEQFGTFNETIYEINKSYTEDDIGNNTFYFRWTIGGDVITSDVLTTQRIKDVFTAPNITSPIEGFVITEFNESYYLNWGELHEDTVGCYYQFEEWTGPGMGFLYDLCEDINNTLLYYPEDSPNNLTIYLIVFSSDDETAVSNVTIYKNTTLPQITITSPVSNYNVLNNGEVVDLNFTISGNITTLDVCWYEYNNTNTTISCTDNTNFTYIAGNNSLRVWVNDTLGNLGNQIVRWYPIYTEYEIRFNPTTVTGFTELFYLTAKINYTSDISSVQFNYNGNYYTPAINDLGGGLYNITNTEIIAASGGNSSFKWEILFLDGAEINSSTNNQSVTGVDIDNCSTYSNLIMNLNLFDEVTLESLNGTIDAFFTIYPSTNTNVLINKTLSGEDVSTLSLCSDLLVNTSSYRISARIKYVSEGYAPELYFIQLAPLSSYPVNLSLYDLNLSSSTEFLIRYQDDTLTTVEGAVIQLIREYISEGTQYIVEAPLTSNVGTAVVHIDLNSNIYSAIVVKNGVILDTFENIVFNCENELSGICTQNLFGKVDPQNSVSNDLINDFSSSVSSTNNTLTVTYSMPSGTPANIRVVLEQKDIYGQSFVCNKTVVSSSGFIVCDYEDSLTDSMLLLKVYKNGELLRQEGYVVTEAGALDWLGNNFFIVFILVLSLVGMAMSSPEWMVINSVISLMFAGGVWLVSGLDFVIGLGTLAWLIIAAVIIIIKLSKQEDR